MFDIYNRRKASIGFYDPIFRNLLERGQKIHPELFTTEFFIGCFSIKRSLGSGATMEAENKNVDTADIELINRLRKRKAERGTEAGLSMQQVHTQVSRAIVASLRFSTLLSESSGQTRGLFLMILSLTISRCIH